MNKHLRNAHDITKIWNERYSEQKGRKSKIAIDTKTLLIVKAFVTMDIAVIAMANESFKALSKYPLPCQETFRTTILPKVLELLQDFIKKRLQRAQAIWLLSDIWTNISKNDYLAIGAAITDENFERELVVLDIIRCEQPKTTTHVQELIEQTIQRYEIPDNVLHGITTDQGSNMPGVKLPVPAWVKELDKKQNDIAFDIQALIEEQVQTSGMNVTFADAGKLLYFPNLIVLALQRAEKFRK